MSETVRLVLTIIQVIVSVILMLTVVFSWAEHDGVSLAIDGAVDTFFGKNKARSLDAKLEKLTTIVAVIFILLTFTLTIL
mgnify:CR=1 FL=1